MPFWRTPRTSSMRPKTISSTEAITGKKPGPGALPVSADGAICMFFPVSVMVSTVPPRIVVTSPGMVSPFNIGIPFSGIKRINKL